MRKLFTIDDKTVFKFINPQTHTVIEKIHGNKTLTSSNLKDDPESTQLMENLHNILKDGNNLK